MDINSKSIIQKAQNQVATEIDGEVVMMSIEKGEYYNLDGVGSRIWNMIEKPHSVAEICTELQKTYDVNLKNCEKDVLAFLNNLKAESLIKVTSA